MANVNIGKVALTPAGDYNSTSTYEKLDIVKDQGSSFIAKKAVPVGTTTGNDEYWQMVASIGATGPTGPEGPIGHTIEWGEIEGNIEDQEDLNTVIHEQQQFITNIEPDMKASNNYVIGDLVIVKNKLLRVTQNISSGSSFVIDSNVIVTTIEDELASTYTKTETDNLLNTKANSSSVYTKTETDTLLDTKANVSSVYTKTETDTFLDEKLDTTPTTEMTGDIVTFDAPVDNAIKALNVSIDPVQDLHGYSNPWPAGGGKNLLMPEIEWQGNNGIIWTINADSSVTLSGTFTSNVWGYQTQSIQPIEKLGNIGDTVSFGTDLYIALEFLDSNSTRISIKTATTRSNVTIPEGSVYYRITIYPTNTITDIAGTTINKTAHYWLYKGSSDASTTWTPYSNICPITGHTSATVTRTGKNVWGGEKFADDMVTAVNNSTYCEKSTDTDGKFVRLQGNPAIEKTFSVGAKFKENTRYTFVGQFKKSNTSGNLNLQFLHTDGTTANISYSGTVTANTLLTVVATSTSGKTVKSIIGKYQSGTTYFYYENCGLFEGVLTADDFSPYQAQQVTIDLNGTRYGGVIDVLTGEMTVTKVFETFDGSADETISKSTVSGMGVFNVYLSKNMLYTNSYDIPPMISNIAKSVAQAGSWSQYDFLAITTTISGINRFAVLGKNIVDELTANEFRTWLSSNPMEVCYTLATPITVQLTPAQLSTLLGTNNIWADTGDVSLTLRTGAGKMAYQDVVDYDELTNKPDLDNKADIITGTKSGSIVSISDGAEAPVSGLSVSIEPIQDLHGYDNPWPAGGGKNLIPDGTDTSNGYISGKYMGESGNAYTSEGYYVSEYFRIEASADYTLSTNGTALNAPSICFYDTDKEYISGQKFGNLLSRVITTPSNAVYARCTQSSNLSTRIIQFELGSAATTPMPYSNICPITGHTSAVVTRAGKNLLDLSTTQTNFDCYSLSGNPSTGIEGLDIHVPSGSYTLTYQDTDFLQYVYGNVVNADGSWVRTFQLTIASPTKYTVSVTVTDGQYIKLYLASPSPTLTLANRKIMLNVGNTEQPYQPYQAQQVTIDLDGTIYGGMLNVLTGEMTVNTMFIELDGTEAGWSKWNTQCYNSNLALNTLPNTATLKGYCSHVKTNSSGNIDSGILSHSNAGNGLSFKELTTYWGLPDNEVSTWTGYLAAQKLAGTPVQVLAYLQTPFTVQLTPSQIQILLDKNYIWANTGDISVNYWKKSSQDLIDGVQELIDYKITESQRATRSIIGGIERTNIATKNYVVGEYVIVGDDLLKITTNVASGNSLTIGTNCVKTTVAEALIALASA